MPSIAPADESFNQLAAYVFYWTYKNLYELWS